MHKKTPDSNPPKKSKSLLEGVLKSVNDSGHAFELVSVRNAQGDLKFSVQLRIDTMFGEMSGKSTLVGSVVKATGVTRRTPLVGSYIHRGIFSKTQQEEICNVLDHITLSSPAGLGRNWDFSSRTNEHDHRYIRAYVESEEAAREMLKRLQEKGFKADPDQEVKKLTRLSKQRKKSPSDSERHL